MAKIFTGKRTGLALSALITLLFGASAVSAADSVDAKASEKASAPVSSKRSDDVVHEHHVASSKIGKVACNSPHASCAESEKVIETLKHMSHLYSEGKFDELSKYMDEGCTTFDEKKNQLIVGKEAIMDHIKTRWNAAHSANSPIVSYSINHPYAQVTGDHAVVTFEAVKTVGGAHPETHVARCTDIFVKKDGVWKKSHYRNCFKKGKPSAACSDIAGS